ncbi:MAG: FecR domain-containing protein [Pseudomonadota bacterium]
MKLTPVSFGTVLALTLITLHPATSFAANRSAPADIVPPAVIERVQLPAWIERNGVRHPVTPGIVLKQNDRIITGEKARILLTLVEGSKVKLGENAELNLDIFETQEENKGYFLKSVLNVAKGAFRFTTDAASKIISRRNISVRFSTVTVGIRGTDLWGKQADDKEIVCLIEGKIEVNRMLDGKATDPVTLDQALQFYIAPTDKPTLPIAKVSDEQLGKWAADTEIGVGTGSLTNGGAWKVTLAAPVDLVAAFDLRDSLRKQGYPAEVSPALTKGTRVYAVVIASLSSQADAEAIAALLGPAMNLKPTIGQQRPKKGVARVY